MSTFTQKEFIEIQNRNGAAVGGPVFSVQNKEIPNSVLISEYSFIHKVHNGYFHVSWATISDERTTNFIGDEELKIIGQFSQDELG